MEINLQGFYGYGMILGKILGYIVILIGIVMTFLLLKTVLFEL